MVTVKSVGARCSVCIVSGAQRQPDRYLNEHPQQIKGLPWKRKEEGWKEGGNGEDRSRL